MKATGGFSHGQTVSHRSHQALFQIGRIGTHIPLSYRIYACHCFSQVALNDYETSCPRRQVFALRPRNGACIGASLDYQTHCS
jgi:hypothetical protein